MRRANQSSHPLSQWDAYTFYVSLLLKYGYNTFSVLGCAFIYPLVKTKKSFIPVISLMKKRIHCVLKLAYALTTFRNNHFPSILYN